MGEQTLFGGLQDQAAAESMRPAQVPAGPPRLRAPDRAQVLLRPCSLEELVPPGHEVRTLWAVVERLDLSALHDPLRARGSTPGRPATDPRLLVALWLWAATQGVGSAREVARLCECHDAYRWLCGGVPVNHHTLSDFRVGHGRALDELFTLVLAMLVDRGLVGVKRISQDGLRVRANAGAGSFKREEKLQAALAEAQQQVEALKRQVDQPARGRERGTATRREAARQRAADERLERVRRAMEQLPELLQARQKQNGKKSNQPVRASVTDPEARKMKMPDGGFRPAYNVQLAADTGSRAIVGVCVCNQGTDQGQSQPMRQQVQERTGGRVEEHLMDGGFVKLEAITEAERGGVAVYAPPKQTKNQQDPYAPQKGDSPEVIAWRQRMGTAEAKEVYNKRASTSETVNADLRCYRGLGPFGVRGLDKVRCVALWSALAYNVMHFGAALLC
jgi:transposase